MFPKVVVVQQDKRTRNHFDNAWKCLMNTTSDGSLAIFLAVQTRLVKIAAVRRLQKDKRLVMVGKENK